MDRKRSALVLLGTASLALAFSAGIAIGQGKVPTENKGFGSQDLRSLDLSEEIDGRR
jgi:hypothetical protein